MSYDLSQDYAKIEELKKQFERLQMDLQTQLRQKETFNNTYQQTVNNFYAALNNANQPSENTAVVFENLVLAAATQIGKTEATINAITNSKNGTITVISCDNKNDQFSQMRTRLVAKGVNPMSVTKNNKKIIKQLVEDFRNQGKLTFLILNNGSQVLKLGRLLRDMLTLVTALSYQVFIDEGDVLSKSDFVTGIDTTNPVVHNKWIQHFLEMSSYGITNLKRIWISATPENCNMLYGVPAKNVFVIPQNLEYRPINTHTNWSGELGMVLNETRRITEAGSKEVILYCTDMKNINQDIKAKELYLNCRVPVVVYNGKGIKIYKGNGINNEISETPVKYEGPISDCLASLEHNYTGPVIVVGYKLMDRGISFVSSVRSEKPLSATVMFYTGKDTTYVVSIAQRLGRITGTSRPDISSRTVYCSEKISNSYKVYLRNQTKIHLALHNAPEGSIVIDVMKTLDLEKLERNLDRPALKKVNKDYFECETSDSETTEDSGVDLNKNLEKMKRLVKSWSKITNVTAIAKIFRTIYDSPEHKMERQLVKDLVLSCGKDLSFERDIHTKKHNSKWFTVFFLENDYVQINQEAVDFSNTL